MIDAWTYSIVQRCREGLEEDRVNGEDGKRSMPYLSREELERAVVKLAAHIYTVRKVVVEPVKPPTLTIEVHRIYP